MFLSDRDIKYAIESGKLIVNPPPEFFNAEYDENSIDLHLDDIEFAKVWNPEAAASTQQKAGRSTTEHVLELGSFDYNVFADTCLVRVPEEPRDREEAERLKVYAQGQRVILKP